MRPRNLLRDPVSHPTVLPIAVYKHQLLAASVQRIRLLSSVTLSGSDEQC